MSFTQRLQAFSNGIFLRLCTSKVPNDMVGAASRDPSAIGELQLPVVDTGMLLLLLLLLSSA